MHRFFLILLPCFFAGIPEIHAQETLTPRDRFEDAFFHLLGANYLKAEAAFLSVATQSQEGSQSRWLGEELAEIAREMGNRFLEDTIVFDRTSFVKTFSLWLDGKSLEARSEFLQLATLYPEKSFPRELGRLFAELARSASELYPEKKMPFSKQKPPIAFLLLASR